MRQSIRNLLLLLNLLLLPVTIFYISPVVPLIAAKQGIVNTGMILFALIFVTSLLLGRSFCGWLCGFGALQEYFSKVNNRKVKGGIFSYLKYLLFVPWIMTLIGGFIAVGGIKAVDYFFFTTKGVSIPDPASYVVLYSIYFFFIILSLIFGRRAFCHYVCPIAMFNIIGSGIKELLRTPGLRLKANKNLCMSCQDCSTSCPKSLDVNNMVKKNKMYHPECILCGVCVDTCQKKAISYTFFEKKGQAI